MDNVSASADSGRNRGELAEGWYDPATKRRVNEAAVAENEADDHDPINSSAAQEEQDRQVTTATLRDEGEEEDDDYGPTPAPSGPAPATFEDLAQRDDLIAEQAAQQRKDIRVARKANRVEQRERMEDLTPRAEGGTKERALEKKRENSAAAKSYQEGAEAGGPAEVAEKDLMGDSDEIKVMRVREERKKNERELKREEALHARALEREERMKGLREKEDKTMGMLKQIARERFG